MVIMQLRELCFFKLREAFPVSRSRIHKPPRLRLGNLKSREPVLYTLRVEQYDVVRVSIYKRRVRQNEISSLRIGKPIKSGMGKPNCPDPVTQSLLGKHNKGRPTPTDTSSFLLLLSFLSHPFLWLKATSTLLYLRGICSTPPPIVTAAA